MDYSKNSVKELKQICKDNNIVGYSKKNKTDLINIIKNKLSNKLSTIENDKSKTQIIITNDKSKIDTYSKDTLIEQYKIHKEYVIKRKESAKLLKIKVRLPSIPEDITENIIKFIIHKNGDKTSSWNCKTGDLISITEGKQECKCFTSNGPPSFTPKGNWNVIYFLDARKWLENKYILYKISLQRTSSEWKNIKINQNQSFDDQCKQGRRPRIKWDNLYPQIESYCKKIFDGVFEDIF